MWLNHMQKRERERESTLENTRYIRKRQSHGLKKKKKKKDIETTQLW